VRTKFDIYVFLLICNVPELTNANK